VSASEDAASAPEPVVPSNPSSPTAKKSGFSHRLKIWANIPAERELSILLLGKPLPMGLLPHIPLEAGQVFFPKPWPSEEFCEMFSSLLLFLLAVAEKSPKRVDRTC
jgi:hypothetical protein